MKKYISKVIERQNLTSKEAEEAMNLMMGGKATEAQIGSYLTALRMKGETIEEITGSARGMRENCLRLKAKGDVLDIVGTGGDGSNTFNVSTIAAFIIASEGIQVAKHGNRGVSSKCGSADVLEALGVPLNLSKQNNEKVLEETGMCFMFAPIYHSAMKYVAKPRRELGVRTLFNVLGPLANPAFANLQVMGVYDENLLEPIANVLKELGIKRAMVVYGRDGVDEISICDKTKVCEIREGEIRSYLLDPVKFGFHLATHDEIVGGEIEDNKRIALSILKGEESAKTDMVILNAAAALYVASCNETFETCIDRAREALTSGRAYKKLNEFIEKAVKYNEVVE